MGNGCRALLTDGNMKVKGSENIWAIGDCSTIEQNRLLGKVLELFQVS
jgi:NADH dehydrogenase FAD-containing subunit